MWRVALSTGTDRWHCTETPVCQPERLLQTMCFVFPNEAWSTNEEGRADVSSVQLNCALIAPCHWSDLPLIGGGHSAQTCVCVCVCVCAPDITLNQLPHLLLLLLRLTPPIKPPSVRPAEPERRTVHTHAQKHTLRLWFADKHLTGQTKLWPISWSFAHFFEDKSNLRMSLRTIIFWSEVKAIPHRQSALRSLPSDVKYRSFFYCKYLSNKTCLLRPFFYFLPPLPTTLPLSSVSLSFSLPFVHLLIWVTIELMNWFNSQMRRLIRLSIPPASWRVSACVCQTQETIFDGLSLNLASIFKKSQININDV